MSHARVLIAVPTRGQRTALLRQCLDSIAGQGVPVDVVIVGPKNPELVAIAAEFDFALLDDPGSLPKAINLGLSTAQAQHEYLNWLGDDDLLVPGSAARVVQALDEDRQAVVAYGACRYIDDQGHDLWVNRAGPWANRLLSWGPDLIPQPGMLIRADAWKSVGGLDTSFSMAFDLDLLLRLRKIGTLIDVGEVVACFRWHASSLTAGDRTRNLQESERAKRASLSPQARRWAWAWEPPVRVATRLAAWEVHRRARSKRGRSKS